MAQTRYIKGKNGKMLGSIGAGKADVPTAGTVNPAPMLTTGTQTPAPTTADAYERFQVATSQAMAVCGWSDCTNPIPADTLACDECTAKRRDEKEAKAVAVRELGEALAAHPGERLTMERGDGKVTENVRVWVDDQQRAIYQLPRQRTRAYFVPPLAGVTVRTGDGQIVFAGDDTYDGMARKLAKQPGWDLDAGYAYMALAPRAGERRQESGYPDGWLHVAP